MTPLRKKALARLNVTAMCAIVVGAHAYILSSDSVSADGERFLSRFVLLPLVMIFAGFMLWFFEPAEFLQTANTRERGNRVSSKEQSEVASYLRRNTFAVFMLAISFAVVCSAQFFRSYNQTFWWMFVLALSIGRDMAILVRSGKNVG